MDGYAPQQQSAAAVDRDGRLIVRLADAGPFDEGNERFATRQTVRVPANALIDQIVIEDRPCYFLEMFGFDNGVGAGWNYVQLHDASSPITNGDVPVFEFPVPREKGQFALAFGFKFSVGLVVALSTTQGAFTGGATELSCAVKVLAGGG